MVPNPWLNSDPGGEIYLFVHRLAAFITWAKEGEMSRDIRFPTMWYVRPAKPQISLRIRAV